MANKCNQCGTCCKLFYINLNKKEYLSGKYQTLFQGFIQLQKFSEVKKYGANLLAKKEDGSCIYLKNSLCGIHGHWPEVCRRFFCSSQNKKFRQMIICIQKEKLKING